MYIYRPFSLPRKGEIRFTLTCLHKSNSYYASSFKTGSESGFRSDIPVLEFKADKAKRINLPNDNMGLNLTDERKKNSVLSAIESTLISNLILVSKKTKCCLKSR